VVSVDGDASLAERYAATCAAFAVAEGARANGEDVLLVLDDFTGLVEFTKDMARLSPQLDNPDGIVDEEKMVEYEGMIINAILAERRRFLGNTLQRVARMSDALGGGSLTLLGVMYHEKGAYRGRKGSNKDSGAVGSAEGTGVTLQLPAGFDEMRPEMQAKITAALEKKRDAAAEAARAREAEASAKRPEDGYTQHRSLVEEFMSITDGQVMVENFSESNGWGISVKDSVSRIGTPGAAGPLKSLDMMQLRLDVMQADDMQAFGNNGDEKVQMRNRSSAIRGVLRQRPGETAPLSAQTVGLFALQKGFLKNMNADEAAARVDEALAKAKDTIPEVLEHLDANPSKALSAEHSEKLASLFA
jgi:F-type H+-transporting ATPase subunit alpha